MNAENRQTPPGAQPAPAIGLRIEVDEIDHLNRQDRERIVAIAELLAGAVAIGDHNKPGDQVLDLARDLATYVLDPRIIMPSDWLVYRGGNHVAVVDRRVDGDHKRCLLVGIDRELAAQGFNVTLSKPADVSEPADAELLASPVAGLRKGGAS